MPGRILKLLASTLFFPLWVFELAYAQDGADLNLPVGEICVSSRDPVDCMQSYGFQCDWSRRPQMSLDAHTLSCNLSLQNGSHQYVQFLYENGGWVVESQGEYESEADDLRSPYEDSHIALSRYIREAMQAYSIVSDGSGQTTQADATYYFQTGFRQVGGQRAVRSVCGIVLNESNNEAEMPDLDSVCEADILNWIRMLGQSTAGSPYRAAGAAAIEWKSSTAYLASGASALIIDGQYTFDKDHQSCRLTNDCCSRHGSAYLESCREPTETELLAISGCLADGLKLPSGEYFECLRNAGIKVGCQNQEDGSRICY